MRLSLGITCMLVVLGYSSEQLPSLPSMQKDSHIDCFLTSEQITNEQNRDEFGGWDINIDGGYAYAIFNDIDVYVGAPHQPILLRQQQC